MSSKLGKNQPLTAELAALNQLNFFFYLLENYLTILASSQVSDRCPLGYLFFLLPENPANLLIRLKSGRFFFGQSESRFFFCSPELLGSQGDLIVCPSSRHLSIRRRRPSVHQFQRSFPLKPLGQSKTNYMWGFLGKGEAKFI